MTTPSTPPGFRPPGEQPVFQGTPLASPKVNGGRFALVALGFLLLAGIGALGFVRSLGDERSSVATIGNEDRRVSTPLPLVSASAVPVEGPVPRPVTYRGSGPKTIAVRKPERGPVLVYVKGANANGLFQVSSVDAGGRTNGLLVHSLKPYEGVRLLDELPVRETAKLTIDATGPWTVQLRSVRSAPSFGTATTGTGDAVVRYTGPGGPATIRGGAPFTTFTVTVHENGFPRLLVVAAKAFDETRGFGAGPYLVEVEATGRWSIRVR